MVNKLYPKAESNINLIWEVFTKVSPLLHSSLISRPSRPIVMSLYCRVSVVVGLLQLLAYRVLSIYPELLPISTQFHYLHCRHKMASLYSTKSISIVIENGQSSFPQQVFYTLSNFYHKSKIQHNILYFIQLFLFL